MKKLAKIDPDLPLTFIGMKIMDDKSMRVNIPVFPTKRHQTDRVPRKGFFKPISRMFHE